MNYSEYKEIRKKLTRVVISTDMALHAEHMKKMKAITQNDSFDVSDQENKLFLMEMCLHTSDLTNPSKLWFESYKWSCLVNEEFFVQGDRELELGIPVNNLTDRKSTNLATSQLGFINFVVKPTIEVFRDYLPKVQINCDNLISNIKKWETMKQE
jgi:hypothetical protein